MNLKISYLVDVFHAWSLHKNHEGHCVKIFKFEWKRFPTNFLKLILNQKGNKVVTFMWVYTETTTKQTYSLFKELMNMEYFRNQNSKQKIWWAQNKQKNSISYLLKKLNPKNRKTSNFEHRKEEEPIYVGGTSVKGNEMIFDNKKKLTLCEI